MPQWIEEARAHVERSADKDGKPSARPQVGACVDDRRPLIRGTGAFRRALTDKLRDLATRSRWTLQQLQRQMAYDRLLERLYLVDEGWIIKGATALLARDIGVRGTVDIDLYREVAREIAEVAEPVRLVLPS